MQHMRRLGAIVGVSAALVLLAHADTIVRIAAYDTTRPRWWNATYEQLSSLVFTPDRGVVTTALFFDWIPDQAWIQSSPTPGRWSIAMFTFQYNPRYIDFGGIGADGVFRWWSELVQPDDPSTPQDESRASLRAYLAPNVGATGVAEGAVVYLGETTRQISLALIATQDANGDEYNESGHGYGYAANFIVLAQNPSHPNNPPTAYRRLIVVRLNTVAIQNELGGVLRLTPGPREGFRNTHRGTPPEYPGNYQLIAQFLVPEPTSALVLGGGVVGLYALLRRRLRQARS